MLAYISSPYNHPDDQVKAERVTKVANFTARLIAFGISSISPIVHNVGIMEKAPGIVKPGWNNWKKQDESMISACDVMIIYCLDGWTESKGIACEIDICVRKSIPYYHADDSTDLNELLDRIIGDLNLKKNSEFPCGL